MWTTVLPNQVTVAMADFGHRRLGYQIEGPEAFRAAASVPANFESAIGKQEFVGFDAVVERVRSFEGA